MAQEIPQSVKLLLWDINPESVDLDKHATFIIERVIEYGDFPEIKWMEATFTREQLVTTLVQSRRISAKSGNFFAWKYNLNKEILQCLQNPYTNKQDRF